MTEIVTRMVGTNEYETFIHEGGDKLQETIIFLHGSGPGSVPIQIGKIYCRE